MQQRLIIFFSDIANSTRLYQDQGDIAAHRLITDCLNELRQTVESHDGKLLRTVGDAVLASFTTSDNAMQAAIVSQRLQLKSPLTIRIGFHAGQVIPDAGDVYGNAVNLAARVASFANAEEIYTTEETVRLLSPELRQMASFLDRIEFKGIQQPMPVYRIKWQEDSTARPASDTRIFTAANRTESIRTDRVLDLTFADKSFRVDEKNPLVRIGRDVDNDILVLHESTSRHHAVIEFHRNRYTITDSSTNGTYLVRPDRSAHFVRRESLALDNSGIIGAGWHPSDDDAEKILYRLSAPE